MVVVDTSVWIRSLANEAPFVIELQRLLDLEDVAAHELVYGELLIGDLGGRRKLLAAYEQMHQASLIPHHDVVAIRSPSGPFRPQCWLDQHSLARIRDSGAILIVDSRPASRSVSQRARHCLTRNRLRNGSGRYSSFENAMPAKLTTLPSSMFHCS